MPERTEHHIFEGDIELSAADEFARAGLIAVDTETSGLSWRDDKLQLVQLHAPAVGTALVRISGQRAPNLANIIKSPDIVKVFHYAPFDLRFVSQIGAVEACNIRCTKSASKLVDPDIESKGHSLKELLRRKMGVPIPKGPVRTSDWSADSLSAEQIRYAISDVAHLVQLHSLLEYELSERSLTDLYWKVCAYIPVDALLETSGIPDPLSY